MSLFFTLLCLGCLVLALYGFIACIRDTFRGSNDFWSITYLLMRYAGVVTLIVVSFISFWMAFAI